MKKYLSTIQNVAGKLNIMFKQIMKHGVSVPNEDVRMETAIHTKWTGKDNISFSVTSDGASGEEWISRLERKGLLVGDYAKILLHSKDFIPTSGITYNLILLRGKLSLNNYRMAHRNFEEPNPEVICLIRDKFSDKELEAMGLYFIIEMNDLADYSIEDPDIMISDRIDDPSLEFYYDSPCMFDNHSDSSVLVVS